MQVFMVIICGLSDYFLLTNNYLIQSKTSIVSNSLDLHPAEVNILDNAYKYKRNYLWRTTEMFPIYDETKDYTQIWAMVKRLPN